MKRFLGFFISRWFLTFIAAVIVALLIWFFGPLLGVGSNRPLEDELPRWIAIAVVFVIWLLANVNRTLRARRREQKLVQEVAAVPPDPDATASAEELALLSDRLKQALEDLRKTRLGGRFRRRYLYQLPWYMFIGPPGAGKTTALANSGLNFPLSDSVGAGVKGVGGTRNCDWWFTDQAVLIDTAGRYTIQDSAPTVDSAAWLGFLGMLKRNRPRQPLNGILLSISLSDLAVLDEAERLAHARAMKQRMRELHEKLGVDLPIYVMFTKADLVAGFVEFFDNLNKDERDQVWGTTYPLDRGKQEGGAVSLFLGEFDALVQRLNDRVVERLHQEPDAARRALIFGFPQQVASLRAVAAEFLTEIFRPSRLEKRSLLRGVYFISATQTGTPIDRLIAAMSGQFGLPRQSLATFSGPGRSFFLTRLLRDVVFGEADLVSRDPRLERRQRLTYIGAYAAAVLVLVLCTGLWLYSYAGNEALIARTRSDMARYREQYTALARRGGDMTDVVATLPALATLRNLPGGYAELQNSPPTSLTWGLYQGYKLGAQSTNAYRRALNFIFLPRLIARVEGQIRANLTNTDILYDALKVYLILGRRGPIDRNLVQLWTSIDFNNAFPGDDQAPTRQALEGHVAALLEQPVTQLPLNDALIEQVRTILRQLPLATRSYNRLMRSEAVRNLPPWRVGEHAGPAASRVLFMRSGKPLDTAVEGIFTFDGYHDTFLSLLPDVTTDIAEDSWVLGSQERVQTRDPRQLGLLRRDVLNLYLDDYVRRWDAILGDIAIKPFQSIDQGLDELLTLSGPNSPLRSLLVSIDAETQLSRPTAAERAQEATAPGARQLGMVELNRVMSPRQRLLLRLFGPALTTGNTPPPDPAKRVDDHFAWLHDFVGTPEHPGPMEDVIKKFNELYQSFAQVAGAPNQSQALLGLAAGANASSLPAQLQSLSQTLPGPMAAMVSTIAKSTSAVTSSGAKNQIADAWTAKVLPFCQAAYAGRYPFDATSKTDVAEDDLAKGLGPKGLIDQFFQDNLKSFVDTSRNPWRWQSADRSMTPLPPDVLMQFQRAAEIRDGLFGGGGPAMKVQFTITPVSLDPQIAQVRLNIDGQDLSYAHGPPQPMKMSWPGPGGKNEIRVTFTPVNGEPATVEQMSGPWALFRFFDSSKLTPLNGRGDAFTIAFGPNGKTASFTLQASSVINPFTMPALHQFRCPNSL